MAFLDGFIFLAFIGLLIFVGFCRVKKIATEESYLVCDRKTNLFSLVATLVMTKLNTATLLFFASFHISKHFVIETGRRVKAYIWNRMSAGSYFPAAVKTVEIPKAGGKKRKLGIPTFVPYWTLFKRVKIPWATRRHSKFFLY